MQNPNGKTPKDGLYPMRTQILRRKLGTPGRTPPAKKSAKRKSLRLQNGPVAPENKKVRVLQNNLGNR